MKPIKITMSSLAQSAGLSKARLYAITKQDRVNPDTIKPILIAITEAKKELKNFEKRLKHLSKKW